MTEQIATKEKMLAVMAGILDSGAVGAEGGPAFRILRIVLGYGRNRGMVEMEIEGVAHEVRVRAATGSVHLPPSLKALPYKARDRIRSAAGAAVSLAERDYLPVGVPVEPGMWRRLIIPTGP